MAPGMYHVSSPTATAQLNGCLHGAQHARLSALHALAPQPSRRQDAIDMWLRGSLVLSCTAVHA